ncbi:MAG: ABC transporter ATP-binding protein [Solirubrobacterales bacterium]
MTAKLEVSQLSKTYVAEDGERIVAVDGFDLEVAEGEFVSIVGPSGCGKSTVFDILAGFTEASSGSVRIDGEEETDLLGRLAYMKQRDMLLPWRTILDNTLLALEVAGVKRRQARKIAREQLPEFGLAGFEEMLPEQLSDGMRQRAALLRTYLAGREILLLDEPFAALDAMTRQEVREWMLRIWEQDRKTILLVTHDIEEAVFMADRAYAMTPRPGRIALSLDVDLPRPRTIETLEDPRLVELRAQLREPLGEAVPDAGSR